MIEALFSFEGLTACTSTSAALLLYKMQRDIADIRKERKRDIADIRKDHKHLSDWVDRIKRHLWPATFGGQ